MFTPSVELIDELNHGPLTEGLALLPAKYDSIKARALILKIVFQESNGIYRDQLEANGKNTILGPALGLGQFERGGACSALLRHHATKDHTIRVLQRFGITTSADAFWRALKTNDVLAMAACRINLLWLPEALPSIDDEHEGHEQYVKAWRPGAWDRGNAAQREHLLERWKSIHDAVNGYFRTHD